jgi:ketosteroid isomerase-like protein
MVRVQPMMRRIGVAVALLAALPAHADPAADARATVDAWFAALRNHDRAAFEAAMLPDATFLSMRKADSGWTLKRRTRTEVVDALIGNPATLNERFLAPPTVLVHGPIATVWGDYDVSIDGKRSHCGVDVFDLVQDGGTWKIANARWTIEPEGCPK